MYMVLNWGYILDGRIHTLMPMPLSRQGAYKIEAIHYAFSGFLVSLGLLSPFLLHVKGRGILKCMQSINNKCLVPFFWSISSLAPIFNIYMTYNGVLGICLPFRSKPLENTAIECAVCIMGFIYFLNTTFFIAYMHSQNTDICIPKVWNIFLKCFQTRREIVVIVLSLWGVYYSAACLILCIPYQILLVCSNPHLYGSSILTVWCAMLIIVAVVAIPFTVDQVFITDEKYRLTPEQALQQILLTLLMAIIVFAFGSQTCSVVLLLRLSKYGENIHTMSTSVSFILRHTLLPLLTLIARRLVLAMRSKGRSSLRSMQD